MSQRLSEKDKDSAIEFACSPELDGKILLMYNHTFRLPDMKKNDVLTEEEALSLLASSHSTGLGSEEGAGGDHNNLP